MTSIRNIHRISERNLIVSGMTYVFFPVAFRLYDLDRDDKISRDELLQVRRLVCHVNMTSQQRLILSKSLK